MNENLWLALQLLSYLSISVLHYLKAPASEPPQQLNMSEEEPSSKRARIMENDQEDQWKLQLRDWLQAAPKRALRTCQDDIVEEFDGDYEGEMEGHLMMHRLLQLASQDSAADEAFAALMENAAYCYGPHNLRPAIVLSGAQADVPVTNLAHSSMPYLKKFLTEIPKNLKRLKLFVRSPEIFRTFPAQIGTEEGSALEELVVSAPCSDNIESQESSLSLGNMLYATRNVVGVDLRGFRIPPPNTTTHSLRAAFQSKTKRIRLDDIVICDESPIVLHPDTTVSLESISVFGPKFTSGLSENGLEKSKLFWRQWLKASRQTLSTIKVSDCDIEPFLEGMCIELANQNLENIKAIELKRIDIDLLQSLSLLASSRVGTTLKRLQLTNIKDRYLPSSSAPAFASFQNLQDLIIHFGYERSNAFLTKYLDLEPPALRKIELSQIGMTLASFNALFSNKTLESIKLHECYEREFFVACKRSYSTKLRSLDIWAGHAYNAEEILRLFAVLPDLRCLKIHGVKITDPQEAQSIVSGISKHEKICFFECVESNRSARYNNILRPRYIERPRPNSWLNNVLRLACLRNRFNASEKQLPLGFIPNVIVRSEELCGESGIFQFLKGEYPSQLGS